MKPQTGTEWCVDTLDLPPSLLAVKPNKQWMKQQNQPWVKSASQTPRRAAKYVYGHTANGETFTQEILLNFGKNSKNLWHLSHKLTAAPQNAEAILLAEWAKTGGCSFSPQRASGQHFSSVPALFQTSTAKRSGHPSSSLAALTGQKLYPRTLRPSIVGLNHAHPRMLNQKQ